MNYRTILKNINCKYHTGLYLQQCGITSSLGECVSIPRFYDKHILSFVVKGEGTYTMNNHDSIVRINEGFYTPPNTITSWSTQQNNPWEYYFMVLDGNDVGEILNSIGINKNNRFFKCDAKNIIKPLNRIIEISETDNLFEIISLVFSILHELQINSTANNNNNNESTYLNNAIAFISNNFMYDIKIHDIANHINIDRSTLYKLFKKNFNTSPIHYLTDYRLMRATLLLEDNNSSLTEIAHAVGFYDYSHFYHNFSKKYNISPYAYRKQHIQKHIIHPTHKN